jgi:poly(hydroxyalkanoate) granule-associated protein
MPPKSKKPPKEAVNNQLVEGIQESAGRIWLAGMGAFAAAQKEGAGAFDSLVEAGERVQDQIKAAAEDTYSVVATKASQAWDQISPSHLGRVFEDAVTRALRAMNIPTMEDHKKLSHRVAELKKATKALVEEMEASKAKRRPRAHAATKRS